MRKIRNRKRIIRKTVEEEGFDEKKEVENPLNTCSTSAETPKTPKKCLHIVKVDVQCEGAQLPMP